MEQINSKIIRDYKGRFVKGSHANPKTEYSKNTMINGMTLSESKKKENLSQETRKKISDSKIGNTCAKGYKHTEQWKKDRSEWMKLYSPTKGKRQSIETIEKRLKTMRERGFDCLDEILGNIELPTSYEQKIISICDKYNIPFKYIGDGKVRINYVNPDFIYEDMKLIIEVYEEFFKTRLFGSCEKYEEQRSKRFNTWGYKTLFIRGKELNNTNWEIYCLDKIKKFILENSKQNEN